MRWDEGHESEDVIDRRGEGGSRGGGGGLGPGAIFSLLSLVGRTRYGWIVVLLVVAGWFVTQRMGGSDSSADGRTGTAQGASHAAGPDKDKKEVQFVSFVLDDTQATWTKLFTAEGKSYRHAKLVLFTGETSTACGTGETATGPFYCPSDERVYIDLAFYDELANRFGAKGDFAQAYVIAHEIGHHVQKLLGLSDKVHNARKSDRQGADSASVRLELQADCFAGVWAKATEQENILEAGDLDEAITAASAIGDDRLQKQATGRVTPDSFTHGTSAQRTRWLRRGYDQGNMNGCDTFGASQL